MATKMAGSKKGPAVNRPANHPDDTTYLGRVALRLRTLRNDKGWSVPEFAAAITRAGYAVGANTIYSWEQARSTPHLEALPAIADALGLKTARSVLPNE